LFELFFERALILEERKLQGLYVYNLTAKILAYVFLRIAKGLVDINYQKTKAL